MDQWELKYEIAALRVYKENQNTFSQILLLQRLEHIESDWT